MKQRPPEDVGVPVPRDLGIIPELQDRNGPRVLSALLGVTSLQTEFYVFFPVSLLSIAIDTLPVDLGAAASRSLERSSGSS